jgi:hypothetical protein
LSTLCDRTSIERHHLRHPAAKYSLSVVKMALSRHLIEDHVRDRRFLLVSERLYL